MTMYALSPPTDSEPMALDLSTLSAAASLARTLAKQVSALVSPGSSQDSGDNSLDSLARYDPATQSWKTWQLCLDGEWTPYSATFPRWGTMRRGQLMAHQPWEPHTAENVSSSSRTWLTPRAIYGEHSGMRDMSHLTGQAIDAQERDEAQWPTPTVDGNYNRAGLSPTSGDGLATAVKNLWPTPVADGDRTTNYAQGGHSLGAMARLWPTPNASQGQQGENEPDGKRGQTLVGAARGQLGPTPSAQDGTGGKIHAGISPTGLMADGTKRQVSLNHACKMQESATGPTPTTQDGANNGSASQQVRNTPPLNTRVGGRLNPAWVCLLMALPADWFAGIRSPGGRRVQEKDSTATSPPASLPEP